MDKKVFNEINIMSTKEVKLTDKQIVKFSAWLSGNFSNNAGAVFNFKSIGELYKRALVRWLVKSPTKVDAVIEGQVEAIMLDAMGLEKNNWGRYKVKDNNGPIYRYFGALVQKYIDENEDKLKAKAYQAFSSMMDSYEVDIWSIKNKLREAFDKIIEREFDSLDKAMKQELTQKIQVEINSVFAEIQNDIDFTNPDSLKSDWAKLMVELKLMKGEM